MRLERVRGPGDQRRPVEERLHEFALLGGVERRPDDAIPRHA